MAIGKFSCFHCGDSIVGHKKDCPELTGIAEATCKHNVKKQKVEIEIDVPDNCMFEKMEHLTIDGIACYSPQFLPVIPSKKVIDMSGVIESGIDCEFSSDGKNWIIYSGLQGATTFGYYPNEASRENPIFGFGMCRLRQSPHVHFWKGGDKCPLPEGLKVKVHYRNGNICKFAEYLILRWIHIRSDNDIIGFEILGAADGWRYEWEKE